MHRARLVVAVVAAVVVVVVVQKRAIKERKGTDRHNLSAHDRASERERANENEPNDVLVGSLVWHD